MQCREAWPRGINWQRQILTGRGGVSILYSFALPIFRISPSPLQIPISMAFRHKKAGCFAELSRYGVALMTVSVLAPPKRQVVPRAVPSPCHPGT